MKFITNNLVKFGLSLIATTILFRYSLTSALTERSFLLVGIIAFLYSCAVFALGLFWGKKDQEILAWHDVGFRFHLVTYLVCNGIGELWFWLEFHNDNYEHVNHVHFPAIIWGLVLMFHFIYFLITRKETIDGIDKTELFE